MSTENVINGSNGTLDAKGTTKKCHINGASTNGTLTKFPHPLTALSDVSKEYALDMTSLDFALKMDELDPMKNFQDQFEYPKCKTSPKIDIDLVDPEEETVYFCNNSLGLMPKSTRHHMMKELDKWADMGVYGHLHGDLPWAYCDEKLIEPMARLVGADPSQVMLMNGLTVNLHLLLLSFYRPTPTRHKIVIEHRAFPSDHYAVESQIRLKGFKVEDSLVLLKPREGEDLLRIEDIEEYLEQEGESIACVCLSGVQYYSGQLFDMKRITTAGQKQGCVVGWDLAHAVGNVEIFLDDWDVDFACWCTYKYLHSGAGGMAGAYINKRHNHNQYPKLHGWWSHDMSTRFLMNNEMELSPGIAGYRISNPSFHMAAALKASLEVFSQTTMADFRRKSRLLTGYLEYLVNHYYNQKNAEAEKRPYVQIISPDDPDWRGCQLSLKFSVPITQLAEELHKRGVVFDKREPNVLRMAPDPLVNKFKHIHRFMDKLSEAFKAVSSKNESQN